MPRPDRWRPWWREAATVFAVGAVVVVGALTALPGQRALDAAAFAVLLGGVAVLPARRRAPVLVLILTTGCHLAYQLRGYPGLITAVPVVASVYFAFAAGRRVTAGIVMAAGYLSGLIGDVILPPSPLRRELLQDQFLILGWMLAAAAAAEVARHQRAYTRQVEARALDAERTREDAAQQRAAEERLRIARDLHDSLTHSISIIKVQTGVAIHLARKRGEEVPAALLAVQEASTEAMRELRATLALLREDGDASATGLSHLDDLVERARYAGLVARLTISGDPRQLPAPVDRAAYRIVQEALTNVTRHAGTATAEIHVEYGEHALTLQVDDDGRGRLSGAPPPAGVGLVGMRERVTALGGWLQAGPRPSGGFSVHAELSAGDPRMIRVLLVDDQALIRAGFRALLEAEDDLEVVGEAANGREAITACQRHRPDVVLLDIQMPLMDGIEATRRIAADPALSGVHVVILTNFGVDEHVYAALRAGASGFLVKDTEPADLLHGIRVAARGDALLSPTITRRLIGDFVSRRPPATPTALAALTNREREVVSLAAHGLSNDEIAARIVVSPMTAKTHISRAMTKLNARDRAQLVVFAYESGLVSPGREPSAGSTSGKPSGLPPPSTSGEPTSFRP